MAKQWMLLYGKNSVYERLKCNANTVKKVFLRDNFHEPSLERLLEEKNIAVERVPAKKLSDMRQSKDLQGIVARVERFRYSDFDEVLRKSQKEELTFLFLDRISDPQNLGVILRVAACFGRFAVVLPRFEACEVTETVLHVAQGGENYVPMSCVTNLRNAVFAAKESGYWIGGGVIAQDARDILSLIHI